MKRIFLAFLTISLVCNTQAQEFSWAADFLGESSIVTTIAADNDGSTFSAVVCIGTVDVDPGPANWPINGGLEGRTVIQKLDVDGNLLWVSEFIEVSPEDGIIANGLDVKEIKIDADGSLLLTGSTSGRIDFDPSGEEFFTTELDNVYYDIFILKLDKDGGLVWAQTLGSTCLDHGQAIEIDQNEAIYVTGTFCNTVDFDFGPDLAELEAEGAEGADVFVLKLSSAGDFIWAKSIPSVFDDQVFDLVIDKNNNLYIGGFYKGVADFDWDVGEYYEVCEGEEEAFLLKINASGAFEWVNTLSGPAYSKMNALVLDIDGNICAVGDFTGNEIDFDPSAAVYSLSSFGERDIFVAKYTDTGALIWAKQLGGALNDGDAQIALSAINTLYITGTYQADIDVDPSAGTYNLSHEGGMDGNTDLFFLTLNEAGDFVNAIDYNGSQSEVCHEIVRGTDGSVYLVGSTSSELDLNHSIDEFMLYGELWAPTGYVLKLQDGNVGLNRLVEEANLTIYPNPTKCELNIQLDDNYQDLEVSVLDQTGRVIQRNEYVSTSLIRLNIDAPNGIYFVQIHSEEIDRVVKVSIMN